jgi:hypothetical protein
MVGGEHIVNLEDDAQYLTAVDRLRYMLDLDIEVAREAISYVLRPFAAYARALALEEAAKVCEESPFPDGGDCADLLRARLK